MISIICYQFNAKLYIQSFFTSQIIINILMQQVNNIAHEYQETFQIFFKCVGILANDDVFSEVNGFKLKQYLEERDHCSALMRGISDHLDKVAFDCGVTKTVGGSVGVAGGIMIGAGIVLAPFTGGVSLGLTLGGAALGAGSALTNLTGALVKDFQLKDKVKYVQKLIENLKKKNQVLQKNMKQIGNALQKMNKYSKQQSFFNWIKQVGKNGFKAGYSVTYKGIKIFKNTTQIIKFSKQLASIIKVNCQIMRGMALQLAAPQLRFFGYNIACVGSRLAIGVAAIGAIAGIVFGIMDIVNGVQEMKGMQQAQSLRETSFQIDAITRQMDDIINFAKDSADVPQYNRSQLCVLISKDSKKLFDFQPPNKHVHLWEPANVKNQMIEINSGFRVNLKNHDNGLYATVKNAINSALIEQELKNNISNQLFTLIPVKNGKPNEYIIEVVSGKVFDVFGSGKDNGTKIGIWDKHEGANQTWFLCGLNKEKVNQNDCGGFGIYVADKLYVPVSFVKDRIQDIGKGIQQFGSLISKYNPLIPKGVCDLKCSKCKHNIHFTTYYIGNDNYAQCNSCGRFNNIGQYYFYCELCSPWGFCKGCTKNGIIPYGCDTKQCAKCHQTNLGSYKFYGANWNYSNCNNCKAGIGMNCFYWYCKSCKTWGYCYNCTMKGKCGCNG